jgi:predicted transcriptional regulator
MKMLTMDDYNFRKVVEEQNGVGLRIAESLGISPQAVSARLNSERHLHWWTQFKREKRKNLGNTSTTNIVISKNPAQEELPMALSESSTSTENLDEGVQNIIDKSNLKLRELVIKYRGDLRLVAADLGIPKGVDFVEEYLNSEHNVEWWSLCRFNPENDFNTAASKEVETPPVQNEELSVLKERVSLLEKEVEKYRKVVALYETAHKLAVSSENNSTLNA